MTNAPLTHLNEKGEAHMVDVSEKSDTERFARAGGQITMKPQTLELIRTGAAAKGDVLATARIAGIMGAKRTHDLIPLCHPLAITKVAVDFELDDSLPGVRATSMVRTTGKTGVEMEALTAVSIALLTLYDMLKATDKAMIIGPIALTEKAGGRSGHWHAPGAGEPSPQGAG